MRVVRVQPDVPALDKQFDYTVPDSFGDEVVIGTIVRVALHGRRVRGWVTEVDPPPAAPVDQLLGVSKVVGAGPPADVIELGRWAAWRWCGPLVAFLRAASPKNAVRTLAAAPPNSRGATPGASAGGNPARDVRVVAWPPAADRRDLVSERVATTGSTLIVSAESARYGALVRRLERDGHRVIVARGDAPDADRTRAWADARSGACVVVGGRTAVWAPVPDLTSVIVLDEGDEALQEEGAPTWHARDVAVERARRCGAALTLVGVVPTLEAREVAPNVVRPDRSAERAGWPAVRVVDMRAVEPGRGLLTDELAQALHRCLETRERALCVINRKGRARLLVCANCNAPGSCERCGAAVVEDEAGQLLCTQCATTRPLVCLECHAARFKALRPGISRLRDDLAALLPRAEVAEVDASVEEVPEASVLVGTEAVLHRAQGPVGLVALLDLDQELLAPRYRAAEQAVALVARGARRTGPGGVLLLQTRMTDHPVVETAQRADPSILPPVELAQRRELRYPPFGALAELVGAAEPVEAAAEVLRDAPVDLLGPTPHGQRMHALVRADDHAVLADALADAAKVARALGRLRIAVDPPRV